jgi:hypothetical protein
VVFLPVVACVDFVLEAGLLVLVFATGFFVAGAAVAVDGVAGGSWRVRPPADGSVASSVAITSTQILAPTFARFFARILVQPVKLASLRGTVSSVSSFHSKLRAAR